MNENCLHFLSQYGLCHTFNLGNNGEQLLQSTSNQKDLGLLLIIDIDNTEYYGDLSYLSTGIKVVVHDQKEHPMVEELGNDVMPGFTTTIKIKHKRVNLSRLRNYLLLFSTTTYNYPLKFLS